MAAQDESDEALRLTVLRSPRFAVFWVASLLSNIGTWAQNVAQPWLMLSIGASPFLIGLDNFALSGPVWFLMVFGGFLADKADRRKVIALFQAAQMLCPILLIVLLLMNVIQPWMVILVSLVVGVTDALSMPSFQTIVPSIVPRRELPSALALNSMQFNLSRVLGPSIAGVLLASVGAAACFAINAASYVPFILIALWMLPKPQHTSRSAAPVSVADLFAGVRSVLRSRSLSGAIGNVLVTSLFCAPLVVFCPVLVREAHGDVTAFSVAAAAFGVGGVLGAGWIVLVGARKNRARTSTAFVAAYAATVVAAAVNPWPQALPLLMLCAGVSMTICNTLSNAILQSEAQPDELGRVVSLHMMGMRGGMSLGALVVGTIAAVVGVHAALLATGLVALGAFAVLYRRLPEPQAKAR